MGKPDWILVRDGISARIADGDWGPGDRLPPEPDLCRSFGVGRHSVRRAIHALAVEGALRAEQGRGTFVQAAPLIRYAIGRRTRFSQNLIAQGLVPAGEVLAVSVVPAPPQIAGELAVADGTPVHRIVARGTADGVPINLGLAWHPVALFPDLGARRLSGESVSDIYRSHGLSDYFRRSTTLSTRRATEEEADYLAQHSDTPVMVIAKVDVDAQGRPIGCSQAVWAGGRVQFSLETLDGPAE